MSMQHEQAQVFHNLHVKGNPLILFNIWDAGSAKAIQETGAKALATGSWSVGMAHGYGDAQSVPLDLVIANLRRIVGAVDLPVSLDFEGGYGVTPALVAENVSKVITAGAVGINFEDQIIGGEGLYSIEEQSARIQAIRAAADEAGVPFFINARTDVFLKAKPAEHNESHLEEAKARATAYAEAGASGFFAPGLRHAGNIEKLCAHSPLPFNVMMMPDMPSLKQLAALGVARISHGGGPYRVAMDALKAAGSKALSLSDD